MSNAFDVAVKALREQGLSSDEILETLSELFEMLTDSKELVTKNSIETEIKAWLNKLCVPRHFQGYECWVAAIRLYKENGRKSMTKEIYPEVAEICQISSSNAERRMRNAIETAFADCPAHVIRSVFGESRLATNRKITNTEFLVTLANLI